MIGDRPTSFASSSEASGDLCLLQIIDLIAETLGIHIQPQHQSGFKRSILPHLKTSGLSSLKDYYQYLQTTRQRLSGDTTWQDLISLLSVTESYFFRDQGQFGLLKHPILPELIERKRQLCCESASQQKPSLYLWSAGCSTGEEAYSLAILLQELIPDYPSWDILILGTDMNQLAIAQAQRGIYSDWSFRTTDPALKSQYFRSHSKGWEIDSRIRAMVTFQSGNLVQDTYPDYGSKIHDLDLIICRNVFIYFDFKSVGRVLEKFYRSLAPGGFLLTGHTELHGQNTGLFQVKSFPQSVVYQRASNPCSQLTPAVTSPLSQPLHPLPATQPLPGMKATTPAPANQTPPRSTQKPCPTPTQPSPKRAHLTPQDFQTYCLQAETHANLGQYSQATQACQQALQINALAIEPYYLLAHISEEQGDIDSAKVFFKRIVYLSPTSIAAYLGLASIYEREHNTKQAQKTWRSLLEVLQSLPQSQSVDTSNQQTIAELKDYVLKRLEVERNGSIPAP